ncbi:hypothetical protein SK571_11015 [Lentzea sp. BCCO 10_0798]|uniref:Novel STAND NTPase 1 domain-containing protein n=1 Tax=Lentzea kristufekii TaxID=3095430 RepID=A0ABU4TNQ1_9PSEU|nr:hypothetical protein [Lentzea sp. BCCO 10_0798]MDX8049912.1 hypothetical protein [Lentzea sp. BCCO 10_0798]
MSPYLGLSPFGIEDAEVFRGRDQMIEDLRAAAARPGLLILVGPSGSGKTSLLHAGLLAAHEGSWRSITPGTRPDTTEPVDLVVVDQLEELFTLSRNEREAFLQSLTSLGDKIVLALNADFYRPAAEHPDLAKALRDNQFLIEPMTQAERRAAIEGPAAAAGLVLEDGLVEEVLHDTVTLPQQSHALWAAWRKRTGTQLTIDGYRANRDVETTAEEVYAEFEAPEREATRRMLPRLVLLGEKGPDTTAPVPLAELLTGLPDARAGQRAVELLAEARLLTLIGDVVRISPELLHAWPRLEEWLDAERDWRHARRQFAADAARWHHAGRLRSLLYRGDRLAEANRRAAASPSRATDLDPATSEFLDASWRGGQRRQARRRVVLALLAVLAVIAPAGLVGTAKFAQQAEQAANRDKARYLAAEAELLRDRKPGLAKQLGVQSYRLDREAGRRAMLNSQSTPGVIADEKVVTDVVHDAEGELLAIVAVNEIILRGREKSGQIRDITTGAVAVNRDGTRLVAAHFTSNEAKSGVLRFYDVTDPSVPRQTAELPMPAVTRALAFSGDTLYAGTDAGAILLWDLANPDAPKPLPKPEGHAAPVDSLAVAPRGDLLASSSADGQIRLWDVVDPARPVPVTTLAGAPFTTPRNAREPVHRAAFDPTGQLLATSAPPDGPGSPNVWRLEAPGAPQRIPYVDEGRSRSSPCRTEPVLSLAFSPHGNQLAVVCGSKWRVLTHTADPAPGLLSESATTDRTDLEPGPVVFDPTGPRLLQVDKVGVYVWDLANPDQPGAKGFVPGIPGTGAQLSYRKAGDRQLIAVQNPGTNTLWDVRNPAEPEKLHTAPSPDMFTGGSIALSENGELLAMTELFDNGKSVGISLRSTENPGGQPLAMIEDLDNGVGEIVFSPTKPLLVISDINGLAKSNRAPASLRLFDIANPAQPRQIAKLPIEAWNVEFSPDGAVLTTLAHDEIAALPYNPRAEKQLRTLDLTDPTHPTELWRKPLPQGLSAEFAYSKDGSLFAAFDTTQTLRLWRVEDHRLVGDAVKASVGNLKSSSRLAFSPDSKRVALIGVEQRGSTLTRRPEIWDVSDPDNPVQQFYLPGGEYQDYYDLTFSPDGTTLAVVRSSAGVDLWNTDPDSVLTGICNAVGDPITRQQWEHYLPGQDYRPPCG